MTEREAGKLGQLASLEPIRLLKEKRIQEYLLNPLKCKQCQNVLSYEDKRLRKIFCSRSCAGVFNNTGKRKAKLKLASCKNCDLEFAFNSSSRGKFCSAKCQGHYRREEVIKLWKDGTHKGYYGKTKLVAPFIRAYLFNKYENKCCKCGWNKINFTTGKIPLEVNHIDGNAENCSESNLELICPNCHSLTPNFRALNKNSKRMR